MKIDVNFLMCMQRLTRRQQVSSLVREAMAPLAVL